MRTRLLVRVAARLAWGRHPGASWRRLAVAISAMALVLALASVWSLAAAGGGALDRDAARTARVVPPGSRDALHFADSGLSDIDGRQFLVHFIAPTNGAVTPPGFQGQLPRAGEAFVSPALVRAAGGPRGFMAQFGLAVAQPPLPIDWASFLTTADEFVVVALVPDGRSANLTAAGSFGVSVDEFRQNGVATPIRRFDFEPRYPGGGEVAGAAGLPLVAALLLCVTALATRSAPRHRRLDILQLLGVEATGALAVGVLDTVLISLPSAAGTAAIAVGTTRRLSHALGTSVAVPTGGAAIPTWGIAVLAAAATVALGLIDLVLLSARRVTRRVQRFAAGTRLAAALVCLAAATLIPSPHRMIAFFAGAAILLGGAVAFATSLAAPMAHAFTRARSTSSHLAGRRLRFDPGRAARLAGLVFLSSGAAVLVAGFVARGAGTADDGRGELISLAWSHPTSGDLARVRSLGVPMTIIVQVVDRDVLVATSCADIEATLRVRVACDSSTWQSRAEQLVAARLTGATVSVGTDLPAGATIQRVLLGGHPQTTRRAATRLLWREFGPGQVTPAPAPRRAPFLLWLEPWAAASGVLLLVALTIATFDRLREPSRSEQILQHLGAEPGFQRAVARWYFLPLAVTCAALGTGAGWLLCRLGLDLDLTDLPPVRTMGVVAASCALAAVAVEVSSRRARLRG